MAAQEVGVKQMQRIWITRPGQRTRKLVLVAEPWAKEGDVIYQGEDAWLVKRAQFDRGFAIRVPERKSRSKYKRSDWKGCKK